MKTNVVKKRLLANYAKVTRVYYMWQNFNASGLKIGWVLALPQSARALLNIHRAVSVNCSNVFNCLNYLQCRKYNT